jgi:hypothetical protein
MINLYKNVLILLFFAIIDIIIKCIFKEVSLKLIISKVLINFILLKVQTIPILIDTILKEYYVKNYLNKIHGYQDKVKFWI